MASRRQWRIIYPVLGRAADTFGSEQKTYDFVDGLRSVWAAGADGAVGSLTVQIHEGSGWQPYEHIDFAEETRA